MYTVRELANEQKMAAQRAIRTLGFAMILPFLLFGLTYLIFPPLGMVAFSCGFVSFLVMIATLERRFSTQAPHCPCCQESLYNRLTTTLQTARCFHCDQVILKDGRPRSRAVTARYHRMRFKALFQYGVWVPLVGAGLLLASGVEPGKAAIVPAGMGLTAIWAYLRTLEQRFAFPAIASLLLFAAALWDIMEV